MGNNNNRYIHKKIAHAVEHIENGSYKLAINLLKSALKDDGERIREGDKNGERTNGKS